MKRKLVDFDRVEEEIPEKDIDDLLQKTRVVRLRRFKGRIVQDCTLYIGRGLNRGGWDLTHSKWANPFAISTTQDREIVLQKYRNYILSHPEKMDELDELLGQTLGCWCKPEGCHGDVLVELLREKHRPGSTVSNN